MIFRIHYTLNDEKEARDVPASSADQARAQLMKSIRSTTPDARLVIMKTKVLK